MSSHDNDQKVPDAVEEAETALKNEALSPPPTNTPEEPQNDDNDVDETSEQTPAHYVSDNEAEAAVAAAGAEAAASAAEANKYEEDNWKQPKVSDVSLKITSSLSSIKQRLFSCFSNIFNDQSSSASAYNDYDRLYSHKTTTTTIIKQQSTKYNCQNDLSILLGEDYDDVIGNALGNLQTNNTTYDYSIYGDNDKDTLLFNIPNDHESIV